jgi:hypothetical protein
MISMILIAFGVIHALQSSIQTDENQEKGDSYSDAMIEIQFEEC